MLQSKLNIIVSGMIAGDPHQGGATWAVLQYVLGLRDLGHRVLLVEPIRPSSIQPADMALGESVNSRYFRQVTSDFGLEESAALLLADLRETVGLSYERLYEFAREADLLINVSGMLTDENLLGPIGVRAYLDLDPAFIQCWHAQGIDMGFAAHTHFVTIGHGIGEPGCPVPTCSVQWIKTNQPIVLRHWPVAERVIYDGLTTIGNWRGYGSVEHNGEHYGQKAHSLRRFFDLPLRTSEQFMLAMAIHSGETADLVELDRCGWNRLDPAQVAATPRAYQEFIGGSKAEFGIAKSGYVLSRCGWFSDRSVCYLASGRPVIAQETGFSDHLPTGNGLFKFDTTEDVLIAIDSLNSDYDQHCAAARGIAENLFDSRQVLLRLIENLGASA